MSRLIGDAAAIDLLDKHDHIIRQELATYQGREVKHTGDGVMASFKEVTKAIQCAIAIQKAFRKFNEQKPVKPLHVRIGINAGEPVARGDDLFGMTVQLAARVCNHCSAEEILVSGIVREFCVEKMPDVAFVDAGKGHFKGFEHAIQLYKVSSLPPKTDDKVTPSA